MVFKKIRGFCFGTSDSADQKMAFSSRLPVKVWGFLDCAPFCVSEILQPEIWHVGVPNCELLAHRFLFLGMFGVCVLDLSRHRFGFCFWDAGSRFLILGDHDVGMSCLRVVPCWFLKTVWRHCLFEHGFRELRGVCAGTSNSAGRNPVFINGCRPRFWVFGTPLLVLFLKYWTPELWHVWVPICELLTHRFLFLGMMGLYVFVLSRHRFGVFVFEMMDPDF